MRMIIQNLGVVETAKLEVGDLTIVCGNNNLGKTYVTYAFYGMLKFLRTAFAIIPISQKNVAELVENAETTISLKPILEDIPKLFRTASVNFSKNLAEVFAADKAHFEQARFSLEIAVPTYSLYKDFSTEVSYGRNGPKLNFSFSSTKMEVHIRQEGQPIGDSAPQDVVSLIISDVIRDYLIKPLIPDVYISSTERTGVVSFQRELDFTRNRLLELVGKRAKDVTAGLLFTKFHSDYPLPVRDNVDFIRNLPNIAGKEGVLASKYPEILDALKDIIGGSYKATKDGFVSYMPARGVKLRIAESSSSIRSLLDVTFYIRHVAKPGDIFMIDEPELNLHPSNQRKIARLIARLVNCGIKVFMTTHSDYIVKEINTLLLLKQQGEGYKKIAIEEKYSEAELLDASRVKVYVAANCLERKQGNTRKSRCQTFSSASVTQDMGIEIESFDKTIDEMNRIQDRIFWEVK
ncbi:MAG: ATP-binding protein [Kiritimatiellae bacterium]|nr:ATP-binding protein [Kiritimatiellia bacterium]